MLSCCFDLARSQGRRELKAVSTVVTRVASRRAYVLFPVCVSRACRFAVRFEASSFDHPREVTDRGSASHLDSRGSCGIRVRV